MRTRRSRWCRDQRCGDDQAQRDGEADGECDVAEQLADLFLDEDDGEEDGDGGCRRGEYRTPNFLCSLQCGVETGFPHLAMAVDVFEDDDGIVDQHADSKRQSGQADHVQ